MALADYDVGAGPSRRIPARPDVAQQMAGPGFTAQAKVSAADQPVLQQVLEQADGLTARAAKLRDQLRERVDYLLGAQEGSTGSDKATGGDRTTGLLGVLDRLDELRTELDRIERETRRLDRL